MKPHIMRFNAGGGSFYATMFCGDDDYIKQLETPDYYGNIYFHNVKLIDSDFENNEYYMIEYNKLKSLFKLKSDSYPRLVVYDYDNYQLGYKVTSKRSQFNFFDVFKFIGDFSSLDIGVGVNHGMGELHIPAVFTWQVQGYLSNAFELNQIDSRPILSRVYKHDYGFVAYFIVGAYIDTVTFEDGWVEKYVKFNYLAYRLPNASFVEESKCCLLECFGITE